jgi:uncharacterized membrane protein required for colicin V production
LSGLDRALGGLFGLVRGIIFPLCVCGIFITLKIDHSKITIMSESKISGILFGLIPLSVQATEKNNATRSSRKKNEIMAKIKKINEAKKISNFKITKPLRDNSKKNSSKITRALATKQGDGLN